MTMMMDVQKTEAFFVNQSKKKLIVFLLLLKIKHNVRLCVINGDRILALEILTGVKKARMNLESNQIND
jgi:hypothetical protein